MSHTYRRIDWIRPENSNGWKKRMTGSIKEDERIARRTRNKRIIKEAVQEMMEKDLEHEE